MNENAFESTKKNVCFICHLQHGFADLLGDFCCIQKGAQWQIKPPTGSNSIKMKPQ